jgi:lipid II:glycine glycyltransferase (peptidoglycan interpeptide bridge formation enzyme)
MVPAMAAAIRWAHAEGCDAFDMGGIPLEGDADEKRRSIAQFKLDFAKTPVSLVGEHARWM